MAKTIKFNLICDGQPVRTLEDLKNNFSIEDIWDYYKNGLLCRWLSVREYDKQLADVQAIGVAEKKEVIKALIKIFGLETDEKRIEQAIAILDYVEESNLKNTEYKENAFNKKQIIEEYHQNYRDLINHMVLNKDNMAILLADATKMENEYLELFILNYYDLYMKLVNDAPKAIIALLTKEIVRSRWIGENANEKIYNNIKRIYGNSSSIKSALEDDIKVVTRDTQGMWDSIERPEVEVMVLYMESGTFVKNAENYYEKLGIDDVKDKFVKLNGLAYQSNSEKNELIYMEV